MLIGQDIIASTLFFNCLLLLTLFEVVFLGAAIIGVIALAVISIVIWSYLWVYETYDWPDKLSNTIRTWKEDRCDPIEWK